jgi:hypothetical protein
MPRSMMRRGEGQKAAYPEFLAAVQPFRDIGASNQSALTVGDERDIGIFGVTVVDLGFENLGALCE